MNKGNKITASVFIGISLVITGVFIICIYNEGIRFWNIPKIDFTMTGQVGDFIGGVVGSIISAAAFWFLYLTLKEQRKYSEKERLENKFFDLIKLHRENVNELSYDATELVEDNDSLHVNKQIYRGKEVFKVIFDQIIMCMNELTPFFYRGKRIYLSEYKNKLLNDPYIVENNVSLSLLAKIEISYCIIFYGVNPEGLMTLRSILSLKYKERFIDEVLRFISLKPASDQDILQKWLFVKNKNTRGKRNEIVQSIYNWRKKRLEVENDEVRNYHNRFNKYYAGYQHCLGHYFRHLFQSVKYINEQNNINYKVKYSYLKILRAQLSTFEQMILFFNSLSQMGNAWECKPQINKDLKSYNKKDFELITKYNLIKNIPGNQIYGIPFKDFYPNIEYEDENVEKNRPNYR